MKPEAITCGFQLRSRLAMASTRLLESHPFARHGATVAAVQSPSLQTRAFDRSAIKRRARGNRQMPNGTVKKVVSDRGFGFIAAEDGKEYFFHRSGLDSSLNFDSLNGGEAVTFEVEASQKGPRAMRVRAA